MWTPNHFTKPVGPHDGTPTWEAPRPEISRNFHRPKTHRLVAPSITHIDGVEAKLGQTIHHLAGTGNQKFSRDNVLVLPESASKAQQKLALGLNSIARVSEHRRNYIIL